MDYKSSISVSIDSQSPGVTKWTSGCKCESCIELERQNNRLLAEALEKSSNKFRVDKYRLL